MLDRVVERENDDDCSKRVVFFDPRRRDDPYFISPSAKADLGQFQQAGMPIGK